ncbi:hypothetical protein [Paraburkholderia sp. SIMBA_030]|uniref:hypothetical protein n=1 Tax=Paraburkholderia sp. SIMBA_030 TaxID=3085773 RepID=UPI003977FD6C
MLFEALDVLQPHTDLLLLDRGYIGNMMVAALAQREIHFCLRVDTRGWTCVKEFAHSGQAERIVTLPAPNSDDARDYELTRTPTTVRLIRDVTPSGRVRVLMTSLLDGQRYPAVTFRRNGARHFRRNDATGNEQIEGSNGDQGCLILPPFASSVLNVSTPGFSPR